MALKLLSEISGKRSRVAKPKVKKTTTTKSTKAAKKRNGSVMTSTEPITDGLLPPDVLRQLFLDVATTDKSPHVRRIAWSFAGEGKRVNVDYLLEDILKSVLYDILTQFQSGLQVQLSRIIDLIGTKAFDGLKELVTNLDNSSVRITEEKVVTAIQELIDNQQIDGSYFEMEQVFVLGKMDKQQFKPKSFRKNFLCLKCANNIELDDKVCPTCQSVVTRCMICKRPISFGEEIASYPKCQNQTHYAHLQEWIKAKGKCPMCSVKLKESDITTK